METAFRSALAAWLRADPALMAQVNAVEEEGPVATSLPALAFVASAAADWSHKTGRGWEIRLAIEAAARGDDPAVIAAIATALETRVATFAPADGPFRVVATQFLRSRSERRARSVRAALAEYRFLILATTE